mmetsp:Transcript_94003/g.293826  ORF Transcript_94003/g.293826 Transcript_94003/m.293826 type:complete len:257 (+) Transcript_94003:3-773(+)
MRARTASSLLLLAGPQQQPPQQPHKVEDVGEAVVQGRRRDAHDRGLADVADDSMPPQGFVHLAHVRLEDERELTTPLLWVVGGDDLHILLTHLRVDEVLQVGCELQGFRSEALHARAGEQVGARAQRGDAEHRGVGKHEGLRAGRGHKVVFHLEAVFLAVAPPPRQAPREVGHPGIGVALVHEGARDVAGAGVEVLVGAPAGKIAAPIVQLKRHIADRMREVEAHQATLLPSRAGDPVQLEELARIVLDPAEHDHR